MITEKQLKDILGKTAINQELSEAGEGEGAPEAGTSSDGEKKTNATKWETGIKRGPGNPLGVGKWSETEGTQPVRGKANPLQEISFTKKEFLKEQGKSPFNLNMAPTYPKAGSDYFASVDRENKRKLLPRKAITKYIYKTDDGEGFFLNLFKGEFSEALLDARDFMFSTPGIVTQWVIGSVGIEVGAPVALEIIDNALVVNDVFVWLENGGMENNPRFPTPSGLTFYEQIEWHYNKNIDFQNIMVDIVILATVGVVREVKGAWQWLTKSFPRMRLFTRWLRNLFKTVAGKLTYLPKKLGNWLVSKIGVLDTFLTRLESMEAKEGVTGKTTRALVKIPGAIISGYLGILTVEYGIIGAGKILKSFGLSNEDASKAVKTGQSSQENTNKINNALPPSTKEELGSMAGIEEFKRKEQEIKQKIKEDHSYYENSIYESLIADRVINCKRNEFIILKGKKYEGNLVFIINKIYYGFENGVETSAVQIKNLNKIE